MSTLRQQSACIKFGLHWGRNPDLLFHSQLTKRSLCACELYMHTHSQPYRLTLCADSGEGCTLFST